MDKSKSEFEFDPELDFAQFLKEAKTHVSEEARKERTKAKRSWKSSIFSWMKSNKKDEQQQQPTVKTAYRKSTTRQGYVSGPINRVKGCNSEKPNRPRSGPLSGLFNHRKKMEEFQMPYISLGQLTSSPNISNYGPVYLVT
ncbi:hypothetical protein L1887_10757 [Cichorium endivia]|nr:hypothetical protein L1887_10757 [Cichorium endivia]